MASLFLFSLFAIPSAHATTPTNVFISEVAWAGSSLSASDEWIELANPTNETLDLSGWQLSGAASSEAILTLPEGSLIAPQSTILIANYDPTHENSAIVVIPSYVTSSISLSNSTLQITLSNAQGEIMDMIGDGALPLAGTSGGTSTGEVYASMERIYPLLDGASPEAWITTVTQTGMKEGIVDLATPGSYSFETTVVENPVEEITEDIPEVTEEPATETPVESETIISSLFISEFVSDPSEGSVEFIELYNNSDLPLDLTGYTVADAAGKVTTLEGTVSAQSYYLISEPAGKLNNDGDTIVLTDAAGVILETIVYGTDDLPALNDPSVYARTLEGTFIATTTPTPGIANVFTTEIPETVTEETSEETTESVTESAATETTMPPLFISEFVSDPSEGAMEFVELFNDSDTSLDLTGYTIADATGKTTVLEGTIPAQSYYLISEPAGKLNNDGDTIILTDATGLIVETIVYGTDDLPALTDPSVYARTPEGMFVATTTPTPGTINIFTTEIPEVIAEEASEETTASSLFVSEFVSDPSEGSVEFIELYNNSDLPIDLTGYTIADATGKTTVLEGTVSAQSYYLISEPAGKLNNDGDTIVLTDAVGVILETIVYGTDDLPALSDPYSYARTLEGTFIATTTPTPGIANTFTAEIPETVTEETSESAAETESTTESSATSYTSYQAGDLLFNEFVSNPSEEGTEWVEIYHPGTEVIDLAGWTLEDATGKQTSLGEGTLAPGSYLIVPSPKGVLNNDGDTLILKDGQGNVIDTLVYGISEVPAPSKGFSLARTTQGTWQETETTTPGTTNVFSVTEEETATQSTTTETQEETTVTVSYDYTALRLSEIYPNTKGSDEVEEFIEIENTGNEAIDLFGVILEDASGKQYLFSDHQNLSNVDFLALYRSLTDIALNNTGETISLYDPSYELLDQVTYEKTNQGQSLARIHGSWDWTANLTANEPNAFPTTQMDNPAAATTTSTVVSTGEKTSTASTVDRTYTTTGYLLKTVEQAQDLADDTRVQVTGIVSVIPGVLGKQIFYIQDETGGIQIYQYSSDFPALEEGDEVTVSGIMSTSRGERRIKVSEQKDISSTENSSSLTAASLSLPDISEDSIGTLVSISGIVVSKENSSIILEEDGQQVTLRLASATGLTSADFPTGASIAVTGILTKTNGSFVLLPRYLEDIQTVTQPVEEPLVSGLTAQEQTYRRIALTLALTAGIILAGFALSHFAPLIKSYVTHRPVRLGTQETH